MSALPRYRSASEWMRTDPVLQSGIPGFEDDTGKLKIGDGTKKWSELSYESTAPFTLPEARYNFGESYVLPERLSEEELNQSFMRRFLRPPPGTYLIPQATNVTSVIIPTANRLCGCWLDVPSRVRVDRLGFEVTTAAAGTGVSAVLYKLSEDNLSMSKVVETPPLDTTSLGFKQHPIDLVLEPGRYAAWLSERVLSSGTMPQVRAYSSGRVSPVAISLQEIADPRPGLSGLYVGNPVDTKVWPDTFNVVVGSTGISFAVSVFLRVAEL